MVSFEMVVRNEFSVEEIASYYLAEIRSVRPHGPYVLGGYCFGAVVAYEMAQQLKKEDEQVSSLFMLDPPAVNRNLLQAVSATNGLKGHLRELANRSLREKLKYLRSRIANQFSRPIRFMRNTFAKFSWKTHVAGFGPRSFQVEVCEFFRRYKYFSALIYAARVVKT